MTEKVYIATPCCTDADRSDGNAHDALTHAIRARLAEVEAERDAARKTVNAVNRVLNDFGIEYPLGAAGVQDVVAMAIGRLEELQNAEKGRDRLAAENARLRQSEAAANAALDDVAGKLDEAREETKAVRRQWQADYNDLSRRGFANLKQAWAMHQKMKADIDAMRRPVVEAAEKWRTWFGGLRASSMFIPENELADAVDVYRAGQKAPLDRPEPRQGDEPADP